MLGLGTLFLCVVGAKGELEVTKLQHGLLQSSQPVRQVRAIWSIALTFPEAPAASAKELRGAIGRFQMQIANWTTRHT